MIFFLFLLVALHTWLAASDRYISLLDIAMFIVAGLVVIKEYIV